MELTIGNLIKIIIGVIVVAVVAYGVYTFFTNSVGGTFENFGSNTSKFLLSLLK